MQKDIPSHLIARPGQAVVEIREAVLAKEVSNLLEYVMTYGIDPTLFDEIDRRDLQSTGAKVVYDLLAQVAKVDKAG